MKVLVLEDDEGVGSVLEACLQKWKQETLLVADGHEAFENLTQGDYDLLVVDWHVPGLSGTELVRKIRKMDRYKQLPVLMISGQAGRSDIVEAIEAGINGFLGKPFTPAQLRQKIADVWKRRHKPSVDQALERVIQGHKDFDPTEDGPLIIFGEATNTLDGLRRPDRRSVARYMMRAVHVIDQANEEDPDLGMGYLIETRTHDIILRLKRRAVRKRLKLMLTSTDCGGDAYMLMRSVNINKKDDFATVLVCGKNDNIPNSVKAELEKMDVTVYQRSELDDQVLKEIIDEHVIKQVQYGEGADGTPGQRARRRLTDGLAGIDHLPVLPQVYQKVIKLAYNERSDMRDWAQAIKVDPLTCSIILRRARSMDPPFEQRMNAIERAVVQLDRESLIQLVGSEEVHRNSIQFERSGFNLEAFWRHNLAVAFAAYLLTFPLEDDRRTPEQEKRFASFRIGEIELEELRRINLSARLELDPRCEEPYLAGLVHDIGKAAMVQIFPDFYQQVHDEQEKQEWRCGMAAAERTLSEGMDHTAAGAILAKAWGFDPELIRVIENHHAPEENDAFVWLIAFADLIGQAVCPFPVAANYPFDPKWNMQSLEAIQELLPPGFADQDFLAPEDFCFLGRLFAPIIRKLVDERQKAL
jgi:putative nucleotidyltransferase with HDIG domain